jgi:hypothetical protein
MPKKIVPIKYTSRDFESIRDDLLEHVKRYYPDTFRDFNETSFGSLVLDTVSYVGDILSFYLDYQVNESFLDTAVEYDNVVRLARQLGYKFKGNPAAHGIATFYVVVPARSSGMGPDMDYVPILTYGSEFASTGGTAFLLTENVFFSNPTNEVVVAKANTDTGVPTHYAIKAKGRIVSGEIQRETAVIGNFQRFLRIPLAGEDITQIISVRDSQGHEYFEVDYLSHDVIFREAVNHGSDGATVKSILKPHVVPRRFITEQIRGKTFLQFGHGSDTELTTDQPAIADPSSVILDLHARRYVTDETFDPSNLLGTDKMGISPSDTTLTIIYRSNRRGRINAAVDTVTEVVGPQFQFTDAAKLEAGKRREVVASIEVTNEEPVMGNVRLPSSDEIKRRALDTFATQNRAVTKQDYLSMVYAMPPQFGSIKRCNIIRDDNSFKRNLNMYVVSENNRGNFLETNDTIKNNLKYWINQNKMINDTIDILNAKIVNLGVSFTAIGDYSANKFVLLEEGSAAIARAFATAKDVGESFYITDVYSALKSVDGILDVVDVQILPKVGGSYSTYTFDLEARTTADGRIIQAPENVVFEIRYPKRDIRGTIR